MMPTTAPSLAAYSMAAKPPPGLCPFFQKNRDSRVVFQDSRTDFGREKP
jgi:hypothetical protein